MGSPRRSSEPKRSGSTADEGSVLDRSQLGDEFDVAATSRIRGGAAGMRSELETVKRGAESLGCRLVEHGRTSRPEGIEKIKR